jgi:hypothetical protein
MFETTYLHIGLDKSGSKAIQFACYENAIALENAGYFYFSQPGTVWHAGFASYFFDDPKQYPYNVATGRAHNSLSDIKSSDLDYMTEFVQQAKKSNAENIILSYEGFPAVDHESLKKMYAYLSKISNKIKVIMYCREPLSYAASAISQQAISMDKISVPFQSFETICEKFIAIFGKENMIVRKFSPNSLDKGDIRHDFFNKVGINSSRDAKISFSDAGSNRALCEEAILVAKSLKQLCSKDNLSMEEFYQKFSPLLKKIQGSNFQLSKEQSEQVLLHSKQHTDYLMKNFGINFEFEQKEYIHGHKQHSYSQPFIDSIAEIIYDAAN